MFDREEVELVTILKSAIKLNVDPSKHVVSAEPSRALVLTASATRTSLAVQFNFCLDTLLYSSCKQVLPANAGVAITAIASSAKINETFLQQFVRQLILSSWEIRSSNCWWKSVGSRLS